MSKPQKHSLKEAAAHICDLLEREGEMYYDKIVATLGLGFDKRRLNEAFNVLEGCEIITATETKEKNKIYKLLSERKNQQYAQLVGEWKFLQQRMEYIKNFNERMRYERDAILQSQMVFLREKEIQMAYPGETVIIVHDAPNTICQIGENALKLANTEEQINLALVEVS
eukprot:TRINITY_DN2974_c0_g1_i1.p1 TRINITY_DN2974_c0_g1~~TRINITY_DN2974_c0_g1_i1.p1  ORF type:complete len:169 (+),score=36.73 TRINITY_DN2974_c0_g1_i1:105-611(+)